MKSCNLENICLLVSGGLCEVEKRQTENHLTTCARCRSYFAEIESVIAPLAEWEKNQASIEPDPLLQARWFKAIVEASKPRSLPSLSSVVRTLWHELIWPCRQTWMGMAAIWIVLLVFTGANGGGTKQNSQLASSSQTWQSLQERRQLLAELIPPADSSPAEPPRRNPLQPRSERRTEHVVV